MTAPIGDGISPLATPGNGARVYARATAEAKAQDTAAARHSRVTSTEIGLSLDKFQINYTFNKMTVETSESPTLQERSASFAEELSVAMEQQSGETTVTASTAEDASPTATPRRAALAYAKTKELDTPEAAMRSLGDI